MCRLCVFGCSQSHRSSDTGCCSRTHQNPYLLDTPCCYLKKKEGVVAAVTRGTTQPSLQHARSPTSSTFHRSRGLLDGLLRRSPKGSTQSHPRCLRTNVPLSVGPAWGSEIGGLMRHDQRVREDEAITRATPRLAAYLYDLNIEAFVSAPIISDAAWKKYYGAPSPFKWERCAFSIRSSCRLLRQCQPPLLALVPCTIRVLSLVVGFSFRYPCFQSTIEICYKYLLFSWVRSNAIVFAFQCVVQVRRTDSKAFHKAILPTFLFQCNGGGKRSFTLTASGYNTNASTVPRSFLQS